VHARVEPLRRRPGAVAVRRWPWLLPPLLAAVATAGLWWWLVQPGHLPVRQVQVHGALRHLDEAMLRRALAGEVGRGLFSVDVAALRARVEALAWVETAAVRRVWPDTLRITVSEQVPLARWAGGGFVNARGEVFRPPAGSGPQGLPLLAGPEGAGPRVVALFREAGAALAGVGRSVRELRLDARGAVRLVLDDGTRVALGRDGFGRRLARLARFYARGLHRRHGGASHIDLRYGNGMAVRFRERISGRRQGQRG